MKKGIDAPITPLMFIICGLAGNAFGQLRKLRFSSFDDNTGNNLSAYKLNW